MHKGERRVCHSFEEYWPLYLENHKKPLTQRLHFWGLNIYFLSWLPGIFFNFWWGVPLSLIFGYALAYFTHRYIEKSPFNLSHPYWGLLGNLKMYWLILTRRM